MKRKDEILNSYYTQGADGMHEISADGLLKAMDEYAEQAFNAARASTIPEHAYPTFADYKADLEKAPEPEQNLNATIQFIAESILEQFLPDDPATQNFSFDIKTGGENYTVFYIKNQQGHWEFEKYEQAAS